MRKLRNILNHVLDVLAGVSFLAMVALGCYLMFAVFYIIVYKMTSGVYYQIVSANNK